MRLWFVLQITCCFKGSLDYFYCRRRRTMVITSKQEKHTSSQFKWSNLWLHLLKLKPYSRHWLWCWRWKALLDRCDRKCYLWNKYFVWERWGPSTESRLASLDLYYFPTFVEKCLVLLAQPGLPTMTVTAQKRLVHLQLVYCQDLCYRRCLKFWLCTVGPVTSIMFFYRDL